MAVDPEEQVLCRVDGAYHYAVIILFPLSEVLKERFFFDWGV
jgi:hypothetical protein